MKSLYCFHNHETVLGLDPRTIRHACQAESGPRIKSEGGAVGFGSDVSNAHSVIPAKGGTPVFLAAIANGGSRFRGNDVVDGVMVGASNEH